MVSAQFRAPVGRSIFRDSFFRDVCEHKAQPLLRTAGTIGPKPRKRGLFAF
jgi:hypothetical protein